MTVRIMLLLCLLLLVLLSLPGLAAAEIEYAPGQEALSLEEYLARGTEEWFLTGKKEYTVQAMMVSRETAFHNELEVTDYTVTDDGVTVILKGMLGKMWAYGLEKVMETYTKPDGSEIRPEDFAVRDEYIDLVTRPQPDANFAMYVPLSVSVTVETAWGDVLHTNLPNAPHGDGDFLLCRTDENGKPDLSDVWVLNGALFSECYDTSRFRRDQPSVSP